MMMDTDKDCAQVRQALKRQKVKQKKKKKE